MTDTALPEIAVGGGLNTATLAQKLGGRLSGETLSVTRLLSADDLLYADLLSKQNGKSQIGGVVVFSPTEVAAFSNQPDKGSATKNLGALIVPNGSAEASFSCPVITVPDTRLAFAQLSALFAPPLPDAVIAETAIIHPDATLGEGVSVGVGAVVGAKALVGKSCHIGAGCVVGEGVVLGEDTLLHAHVTLYPGVTLGARVILHSGVVVGADGFGYAFGPQGALKIHHHGTVVLEDDVEVGANSCIDRGTLHETRIGARTKIDNLCQLGHNVVTGPDCVIAGASAVGGSTVLGRGVVLGGQVGVTDHVQLGDGVRIAGGSSVLKSVPADGTWAGYPARPHRRWVRELYLLGKLETIWEHLKSDVKSKKMQSEKNREKKRD